MTAPPVLVIRHAVEAGASSTCTNSMRGAVVFDPRSNVVLGIGWNSQPEPFVCRGSEGCRAACGKLCVHAEARAIRDALGVIGEPRLFLTGLELVHAKVVDGRLVAGGGPSCWQCSREVLDVRLDAVWLYEEVASDGEHTIADWRRYTARAFHEATAAHHNLPLEVRP